jgi:DNA-binding NarL/FixJ family response regulator
MSGAVAQHMKEFHGAVLDGMARALWVRAYMLWATEVDPGPQMGEETWNERAPDNASTRKASKQAADELTQMIASNNGLGAKHPLGELFMRVVSFQRGSAPGSPADAQPGRGRDRATEADLAYAYGEDLAHVCMGTRDPMDSLLPIPGDFVVPHFSVELDDAGDRLSWDGGWTWNGNGCNPCRANGDAPEVLIIEDDPQLQKGYVRYVRRVLPTAVCHIVDNYTAAIGYLETHLGIVLVISDVDLVGPRTGVDVFRWVQEHSPFLVDHYLFVTGGNPHVAQIHHRYLEKPADGPDLVKAIRDAAAPPGPAAAKPRTRTKTSVPPATRTRATSAPPRTVAAAPPPPPAPLDTRQVADAVRQVLPQIRATPSPRRGELGRFGPEKVFISALWRVLSQDPRFRGMTLPEFKRHLVSANRQRFIDLARADLVGAMDPDEVETSEIQDMGATFHFVVDHQPRGF